MSNWNIAQAFQFGELVLTLTAEEQYRMLAKEHTRRRTCLVMAFPFMLMI